MGQQPRSVLGEHLGGGVVLAQGHQAPEAFVDVAADEVQPSRPEHGGVGLLHVDATGRDATAGHLEQQRVDPEAHVTVRVLREVGRTAVAHAAHEEAGGLQPGERLARQRVVREVLRRVGGEGGLRAGAQEEVALPAPQRREDLARDQVRDTGTGRLVAAQEGGVALGRGARTRREDDGGAPAEGPRRDGLADLRRVGPRMLRDEPPRLVVGETEDVAADHGQVPQELGNQPAQGQVPSGQQHEPEALGIVVEPLVDESDARREELVRVVDHDEAGGGRRATRLVQGGLDHGDADGPVASDPGRRGPGVDVLEPPGDPQGLAGSGRGHHHGDGTAGGGVQPAPQGLPRHVRLRQPRSPRHRSGPRPRGPLDLLCSHDGPSSNSPLRR